ncbi:MAG: hypothetical protein ACXW4P_03760 [Thermoanaerobaculia bacterium]
MSANYTATGPQPAAPPALYAQRPVTLFGVPAGPAPVGAWASLIDIVLSAAAALTAGYESRVRACQSAAAAALERTTAHLKDAQAHVLVMQEQRREAQLRAIEQERRRRAALHALQVDLCTRPITDAVAVATANQQLADVTAATRLRALVHQEREQQKRVELLQLVLQETRIDRELQLAAVPPPPPPRPDPVAAEVRCIVQEAVHDLVWTDADHLYHAYAGCHYLAARLLRVPHAEAETVTYETVLLRRRVQPIRLAEAQAFQRRYDALQATIEAHRAGDRSAAAEQEKVRAQLTVEQLRKETEELRLRGLEQVANAIRPDEYETTQ